MTAGVLSDRTVRYIRTSSQFEDGLRIILWELGRLPRPDWKEARKELDQNHPKKIIIIIIRKYFFYLFYRSVDELIEYWNTGIPEYRNTGIPEEQDYQNTY